MVTKEPRVLRELLEQQEPKVHKETREPMVIKEPKV